mgnify:CR=1 FL=1
MGRGMVIRERNKFWLRVISAIVGIPVILTVAWLGRWPLILFVGVLYFVGLWEMSRLLGETGVAPNLSLAYLGGLIVVCSAYAGNNGYPEALLYVLLVCTIPLVFLFPRYTPQEAGVTFLSAAYLSLYLYLYLLRLLPDGRYWLLLTLVATWAFDTLAYFAGRRFGKRRLAPELSPGKTVAGFVAGLCGSAAAAGLFVFWLPVGLPALFVLGLTLGIAGQIGDLVFSAVKRAAGLKDAGRLIPGHGGVLDRFDSMLLTAPLVYAAAQWLVNTG